MFHLFALRKKPFILVSRPQKLDGPARNPFVRVATKGGLNIRIHTGMSHETTLRCLGYIGDYTTQFYGDYNKPL